MLKAESMFDVTKKYVPGLKTFISNMKCHCLKSPKKESAAAYGNLNILHLK